MSATRLLVLGVVRIHGKAHGYLVRGELVAWGLEPWANVKWGSIYHALRQLAKEGLLLATQVPEWPGRVDYAITKTGEAEFFRELRDALKQPDHRPDMLGAALVLLPALHRNEAISLLRERLHTLETEHKKMTKFVQQPSEGPSQIRELPALWLHTATSGADWTRGLIARLEGGAYVMCGEESRRTPKG